MESVKNPVVLVHGLWNTVNIFWKLRSHLENQGWPIYALNLSPNNGDVGIEVLAQQLHTFIAQQFEPCQAIDLLGFSMGGLISRYYLQRLGGVGQVKRFVAVSTPHHGSMMAWFRQNPGGVQMRPGSRFLKALNQDKHQLAQLQVTSLWTPFDLLVVPASSGQLAVGQSWRLSVATHNMMLQAPSSLEAIVKSLS
ncbi:MAG: alpha/beta fold hydrolase [Cyanobacteria bacterium P01_A01_bin.114]